MSSFGGDFRLGRTAFVDPGKLRRRRRVRREDAAIKPLPAIILEPDEKSSNEQVRRPGYSDDAIHRAVVWRRLYCSNLFSLRCGPPEFAYPTEDFRRMTGNIVRTHLCSHEVGSSYVACCSAAPAVDIPAEQQLFFRTQRQCKKNPAAPARRHVWINNHPTAKTTCGRFSKFIATRQEPAANHAGQTDCWPSSSINAAYLQKRSRTPSCSPRYAA
jgi:hypothetical protein